MLAITRLTLMKHLAELPRLVDGYARREMYTDSVLRWMFETEESLQRLRSPLASHVAAQRARILAVGDGLREEQIATERITPRKAVRATTSLALSRVEEVLRHRVVEIDHRLDELREKMTSFLAAASASVPIDLPPPEPREAWLVDLWRQLGACPETKTLFTYLNASLAQNDRLYLLEDILENLLSGAAAAAGHPAQEQASSEA